MTFSEARLSQLFSNFPAKKIAVIGDVMLDRYIWGSVTRISPEAPVPVVDVHHQSEHPGGASNVALNIRQLGATPMMFGVVGSDEHAQSLRALLRASDMSDAFLIVDESRPTTVKTRVIAHSQHVVRIDAEDKRTIPPEVQQKIFSEIERNIASFDVMILQDYNKGVMDVSLIQRIIGIARKHAIPVCVDPMFKNLFEYKNTTVFKPNRKESQDALGMNLDGEEQYIEAAKKIQESMQCDNVLLTLGEHGMLLLESNGNSTRVPTRARKVADVSGAGDTVISTLGVMLASNATILEAATVANIAGGLVCEEVGIVPVEKDKLFDATLHYNGAKTT